MILFSPKDASFGQNSCDPTKSYGYLYVIDQSAPSFCYKSLSVGDRSRFSVIGCSGGAMIP